MNKKKILTYLFIGLLAAGATGTVTSCKDYDDDINANKTEINNLKTTVSTLEQSLNTAKTDLQKQITDAKADYTAKIAAAQTALQNAINQKADQTTVDALATKVADLNKDMTAKVASLQAQIDAINTAIDNLKATVATKADVQALNDAVNALKADESNLQKSYNALSSSKADKTALEALSKSLTESITALQNTSATKKELAAVEQLANDLKDGKLDTTTFDDFKTAVNAQIEALTKRVANLESNSATKAELASEVDALTKLIGTNRTEVDAAIATVSSNLTKLQELVDTKADRTELNSQISTVKTLISNLSDEVKALKADAATKKELETEVAKLQAQITKNATDIATNASAISTLQTDLATLSSKVDTKVSQTDFDKKITEINKALGGKVDVTEFNNFKAAYNQAVSQLYAAIGNVKTDLTSNVTDINSKIEKLQKADEKIATDFNDSIAAKNIIIASMQNQIAALQAYAGNFDGGTTLAKTLEELEKKMSNTSAENLKAANKYTKQVSDDLTTLQNKLYDGKTGDIKVIKDSLTNNYERVLKINGELGNMKILVDTKLTSLVFDPQFYYEGVEALDLANYQYSPATVKAVNADGDFKTDAPTYSGTFNYAPDLSANYFLNPSIAAVSNKAEDYKFKWFDKRFVTRAEANRSFAIQSVESNKGKLTVHSRYAGDALKDLLKDANGNPDNENSYLTFIALQYSEKAADGKNTRTVTSDYAAVRASYYSNIQLNFAKMDNAAANEGKTRLYKNAANAIAKAETDGNEIFVKWNSKVSLRDYVNTYRTYKGKAAKWDENATKSTVKDAGFRYEFELVGWKDGNNETSESAHAILLKNDTLRPQMTVGGKQVKTGGTQNAATVGRKPLVRVILRDTVNNKIAAVGYMLVKITDKDVDVTNKTIPVTTATDDYTINCDNTTALKQVLTWHEVEEKIIAEIGISKANFEKDYELVGANSGTYDGKAALLDATQYDKTGKALTTKIGTVNQTKTDIQGHETEVLIWEVKNPQAYELFKTQQKDSISTLVAYKNKTTGAMYYVKFTWHPANKYTDPQTSFNTALKIQKYWYPHNSNAAGAGYDDIHGNVEVVGTTDNRKNGSTTDAADDEYVFNIFNTLKGGKSSTVVAPLTGNYAGLNTKTTFQFVSDDALNEVATSDGSAIYVKNHLNEANYKIASLNTTTGTVALAQTTEAKKLLNEYGHDLIANTLTAKIAVKTTLCGKYDVPVSENTFYVKFLRPINVTSANGTAVDGETGGSTVKLNMTFTDWRDHNFTDASVTKGNDYFKYYGVESITADVPNAESDLTGTFENLKATAPNIKLTWTAPAGNKAKLIKAGEYGSFKYENVGQTVGNFVIRVPMTVNYHWGSLKVIATINVSKTTNNAKRR